MRQMITAAFLAAALTIAACGGDDDDSPETPGGEGDETPTAQETLAPGVTPTQTPLPTPTRIPNTGVAMAVVGGGEQMNLTLSDFQQLPQVDVELVNGETGTGVTLAELAELTGAADATLVTIEGYSQGFASRGFVVEQMADVAETTVTFEHDDGRISLVSGFIEESRWLEGVISIVFE